MKRLLVVIAVLLATAAAAWMKFARTDLAAYATTAQKRDERAREAKALEVAVVWNAEDRRFWDGATLALRHVHLLNHPGQPPCRGVWAQRFGKRTCLDIRLTLQTTPASRETELARVIARDTRFAAVIGHTSTDVSGFAAVSYEATNTLFLATTATDPSLTTRDDIRFIFRTTPDDSAFAAVMAGELAARLPPLARRVGLLYTRTHHYMVTPYLERLIAALTARKIDSEYEKAYPLGLTPRPRANYEAHLAYLRNADALRSLLAALDRATEVPAVVLLDDSPANAVNVLGRLRTMTPMPSVIGAAATDGIQLGTRWQCVSAYARAFGGWQRREILPAVSDYQPPVYAASVFCADAPQIAPIARAYQAATKRDMDVVALQGYDAVMILAAALAEAESAAPVDLAARLRSGKPLFIGTRSVTFALSGDIDGPQIYIRALRKAAP